MMKLFMYVLVRNFQGPTVGNKSMWEGKWLLRCIFLIIMIIIILKSQEHKEVLGELGPKCCIVIDLT